ncbi:glutathione S-transferase kappa 1 [Akanthomyces lecanii RCEF 1005]|uniref:Glutathione S-transferase kappa 1 n=1 Tax=Akanthomyces lecanii RCEF 1005 TaxID=1081108 RepID=A0A168HUT1_CORDF|nr:glutathione S-transferase kappa 1 [Akanthomyces lecanii RCEF 1005]
MPGGKIDVYLDFGNKPPWTLAAKAAYLSFDSARALRRVGLSNVQSPDDLMSAAMTVQPLRAIHYVKAHYPEPVFLAAFHALLVEFWTPPNRKIADADVLREVLGEMTETVGGSGRLFSPAEVDKIMDGRAAFKDSVKKETDEALAKGAFGAPWIWATNAKGESEPFFGSDRFNHVYAFLDIPFQDITVLTPNKL